MLGVSGLLPLDGILEDHTLPGQPENASFREERETTAKWRNWQTRWTSSSFHDRCSKIQCPQGRVGSSPTLATKDF
jgi:hypothetical protein